MHRDEIRAHQQGFDAYRLALALRNARGDVNVDGLTGRLSFDSERRIRRELNWAQMRDGELRPLANASP